MKQLTGHWKRATGAKFLGAWDFEEGSTPVVKIEKVTEEEVMNLDGKKEPCIIMYFEGCKPMILNKTNMKSISKSVGSAKFEDWLGNEVTLFTCQVKAFGDTVDAIRIKPTKPKKKVLPAITPERFAAAIEASKAGTYDITKLAVQFTLTKEQSKEVVNVLNPAK
jgi:hypothetical protein